MLAIDTRGRGVAVAVCVLLGTWALADGDTKGSPTDLEWLRAEVGDGALIRHSDGRIYLTELATADSVLVGNGNQPEFSPDGTKFAWIDGTNAKGRLRRGDSTIHVIAENVERLGGVHWLSNTEVAVVLRKEDGKRWFRVSLAGEFAEIPELTALGRGGPECDIRQAADGVWSYVDDETWRTSDGHTGRVAGTCSVSLSPDGRSVTSLHRGHQVLSIEAIRPGGLARKVHWRYAGGFDNHRWASHHPDYMVVVDEADEESKGVTYPVVMRADGSRGARLGNKGLAWNMVYGDFTVGDGVGQGWLAP